LASFKRYKLKFKYLNKTEIESQILNTV
jgi:hypothetical protein